MKLLNFLNIHSSWNFDPVKTERLKEKLNEFLSPQLEEMDLPTWNKNYQWSGDFNSNGIKHVLEYVNGKDSTGAFQYGNVFSFVPNLSVDGKILSKSKRLQLYERTLGNYQSFEKKPVSPDDKISLWNEYFFDKTISKVFEKEKVKISDWFAKNQNLEQNIQTAIIQIEKDKAYKGHRPDQKFVLAFLFAKNGEKDLAQQTLLDYYTPLIRKKPEFNFELEKMKKLIIKI